MNGQNTSASDIHQWKIKMLYVIYIYIYTYIYIYISQINTTVDMLWHLKGG